MIDVVDYRVRDADWLAQKIDPQPNGCWLWTGAKSGSTRTRQSYGLIRVKGRAYMAHRVVYTVLVEPVPKELDLDHLCRVPLCVNPDHLEPVTRSVNIIRGSEGSKTHCRNGHEYTPENTYWVPKDSNGNRRCRTCARESHESAVRGLRRVCPADAGVGSAGLLWGPHPRSRR